MPPHKNGCTPRNGHRHLSPQQFTPPPPPPPVLSLRAPLGTLMGGAGGLPKRMLSPGRGREADSFPETIPMPMTTFNERPCHFGIRAGFECGQR